RHRRARPPPASPALPRARLRPRRLRLPHRLTATPPSPAGPGTRRAECPPGGTATAACAGSSPCHARTANGDRRAPERALVTRGCERRPPRAGTTARARAARGGSGGATRVPLFRARPGRGDDGGVPLPNRVDPFGALHAVPERGGFTGNRGCLVDDDGRFVRHHRGNLWIICRTAFRGRRVGLTRPRRWTPLFFLDDAVGL